MDRTSRKARGTRSHRRRWAFTLVELLLTIGIVATLLALVLPAIQTAREAARRTHCSNNLRQLGLAAHTYHASHRTFPVGCYKLPKKAPPLHAWCTQLLPYLDENATWRAYTFSQKCDASANRTATSQVLPVLLCPSTARKPTDRSGDTAGDRNGNGLYDAGDYMAATDYGGIEGSALTGATSGANGVLIYDAAVSLKQIRDGASSTFVIGEDTGRGWKTDGLWANGGNIFDVGTFNTAQVVNLVQDNELFSDHPQGAHVLVCDGAVRMVSSRAARSVVQAFCTRAGGETTDAEAFH